MLKRSNSSVLEQSHVVRIEFLMVLSEDPTHPNSAL